MGILTSDMTRLRCEITDLRGARKALLEDLAQGAKEMKDAVAVMQAGFRNSHTEMAKFASAERAEFISGLKRTVTGMRREFSTDLAGAHRAWFGRRR
jgi:hypothetical protein